MYVTALALLSLVVIVLMAPETLHVDLFARRPADTNRRPTPVD